jgi:hypothetical protein
MDHFFGEKGRISFLKIRLHRHRLGEGGAGRQPTPSYNYQVHVFKLARLKSARPDAFSLILASPSLQL